MSEVKEAEPETIPVRESQIKEAEEDKELKCSECGSTVFERDSARGELYCRKCGAIIEEDRIDHSQEWRAFDEEASQKKARAGGKITYTKADRGISTKIGQGGELNKVSGKKRGQYYRMKKWDRRIAESDQRGLQKALTELKKIVSDLKLPDSVYEESARLTEKARDKGIIQGRGIEATVASLAYLVAREQGVPRTLEEVADVSGVKKRKLGKTYRNAAREMGLEIKPANPTDFLPRYAAKLDLSGELQATARNLIEEAKEENALAGRSPKAVVAAAIYMAAKMEGLELTQQEVAEKVDVTAVTIRKNYQEIAENLGMEDELED